MTAMSKFVLPYEPDHTAHLQTKKRHLVTRDWMRRRELKKTLPSIAPESGEVNFTTNRPPRRASRRVPRGF